MLNFLGLPYCPLLLHHSNIFLYQASYQQLHLEHSWAEKNNNFELLKPIGGPLRNIPPPWLTLFMFLLLALIMQFSDFLFKPSSLSRRFCFRFSSSALFTSAFLYRAAAIAESLAKRDSFDTIFFFFLIGSFFAEGRDENDDPQDERFRDGSSNISETFGVRVCWIFIRCIRLKAVLGRFCIDDERCPFKLAKR